ncbi:MAG TPA: ATP-binding protein [Candidatus Humimicrobiaceae bacterium]|nr:ATP-binding protein [Candidatus Humimicrobiaceae bacterium]
MSIKTNWYIITGAPCAGKTKVVKRLASLGYKTTPEVPRILINREINKGKTIKEIRKNEARFQRKVLQMKIKIENKIPVSQITFLDDGGIPGSIAYYRLTGLNLGLAIKEAKKRKYKGVFFLKRLSYKKDYARIEDKKTARKLNKLLYETYRNLKYKVVMVPVKPVKERVEFILERTGL